MKILSAPPKPQKPVEPKEEIERIISLHDIICDYLIPEHPPENLSELMSSIIKDYPNALIEITEEYDIRVFYKAKNNYYEKMYEKYLKDLEKYNQDTQEYKEKYIAFLKKQIEKSESDLNLLKNKLTEFETNEQKIL